MAQCQLGLLLRQSKDRLGWRDCALDALHCFGYALAIPPTDFAPERWLGWKAQCYCELFVVYIILDKTEDAWLCAECIGKLGIVRDANMSHSQIFASEYLVAGRWRWIVTAAKEAYVAQSINGQSQWKTSRSFRVNFALKFEAEVLVQERRRHWPSSEPLTLPDFARFVHT